MSILRGLHTSCTGHQVKPPGHQVSAIVQGRFSAASSALMPRITKRSIAGPLTQSNITLFTRSRFSRTLHCLLVPGFARPPK
ncbi:hypothetical protein HaLaN_16446, partial [Haematococcus lacustris]